tara:strand:- start:444 stop:674 length:231 start_codon:yes stop_codon:yes gene_type:complete
MISTREGRAVGEETSDLYVTCVSCGKVIEGLTEINIEDYPYFIDDILPAHPRCYSENLEETKKLAERLDQRRMNNA